MNNIDYAKLRELFDQGLSRPEIAKRAKMGQSAVSRHLARLGLTLRNSIDDNKVKELVELGMTSRQIAKELGFHESSIDRARGRIKAGRPAFSPRGRDAEVTELTIAGKSRQEIADHMGITVSMVTASRKRTGVRGRNHKGRIITGKYDREEFLNLTREGWSPKRLAEHFQCTMDTVYRIRVEMGLSTPQHVNLEPFEDRLAQAGVLIEDGASFSEVMRTVRISRPVLAREFPGKQWTQEQATEMAIAVRQANRSMRGAWIPTSGTESLTTPIESHRV